MKNGLLIAVAALCLIISSCGHRDEARELCTQASTQLDAKNYKQALETYNKAIAADSTYAYGWEGRGAAEYYLDDSAKALKDELKAFRMDSSLKNVKYWIANIKRDLGAYRESMMYYNMSLADGTTFPAKHYEGLGADEYYLGDYKRAKEYEDKAIDMDPTLEYSEYWRGMIERMTGDYEASKKDFDRAIAKNPNYAKSYEWRASAEYHLEEYDAALTDVTKSMTMDSTLKKAYNLRAVIRQAMKDYKGSEEDYNVSLKIKGANDPAIDYEGRAIDEYHLEQYDSALADINKALSDTSLQNVQAWKDAIEEKVKKKH